MRELIRRLHYLVTQRRRDAELAEEMAFHAELSGRRAFGSGTLAREDARAVWIAPWLESVWQDAAYAIRNLRRHPGFAAVVVGVLGAIIGLHATLASLIAGVMLRPWPGIRDASRVVTIHFWDPSAGPQPTGLSLTDARAIAGRAHSLTGLATMTPTDVRLGSGGSAEDVPALMVSGHFFELLGVAMAHGRGFALDEDRAGAPRPVAVLAFDYWQARFGGDAGMVGREIRLNDVPFVVIGIAPREFSSAEPSYGRKLFVPTAAVSLLRPADPAATKLLYDSSTCCSDLVARLAAGATREQARAEIDLLNRSIERRSDEAVRTVMVADTAFLSHPGRSSVQGGPLVAAALISAGLVLVWLIACANIGNLLLARAAGRGHEIAIRLSLGASRGRLLRQLLTEGLVLGAAASIAGVAIAYKLPFAVLHFAGGASASFPFEVKIDGVVIGYAALVAGLSTLAFALAPSLHAIRADTVSALNQREGLPASAFRLRSVLLGVQVAVSVVLLVSAGLLVRGAQRQSQSFDPGFAVDDVTVVSFDLPASAYDEPRRRALASDVAMALQSLAPTAVQAFGFGRFEPTFIRRGYPSQVRLPRHAAERATTIVSQQATAGYIDALRIPIVAGRNFAPADTARAVAVINETMARKYWPDENPVGKTFLVGRQPREVIGVMRDAHIQSMLDIAPFFYEPLKEMQPFPKLLLGGARPSSGAEVAAIVTRLDPHVHIQTMPLSANLEAREQEARTGPIVSGILGAFALLLATIGMFGVFAYAVRQRTREIGIRLALGAQPSAIVRLVIGGHSRAVAIGLLAGAFGAVAASVVLRSRLHGMSPFDPIAYLGVAAILSLAGLAASVLPVRRAVRVDPVVALRYE